MSTEHFVTCICFTQKVPISTVQIILLKVNHSLTTFVVVATLSVVVFNEFSNYLFSRSIKENWEYSSCQFLNPSLHLQNICRKTSLSEKQDVVYEVFSTDFEKVRKSNCGFRYHWSIAIIVFRCRSA